MGFAVMSGLSHGVAPVQGKLFAYPTRNFATLGTVVTPSFDWMPKRWSGHFCLTPHVAMGVGLYHHQLGLNWRSAYSL